MNTEIKYNKIADVVESQEFLDTIAKYIADYNPARKRPLYVRPGAQQVRFLKELRSQLIVALAGDLFPGLGNVRIDRIRYEEIAHLHTGSLTKIEKTEEAMSEANHAPVVEKTPGQRLNTARDAFIKKLGHAYAKLRSECAFPLKDITKSTILDSHCHVREYGDSGFSFDTKFPSKWESYADAIKRDKYCFGITRRAIYTHHVDHLIALQSRGDYTVNHVGVAAIAGAHMTGEARFAGPNVLEKIQEGLLALPVDTQTNLDIACIANVAFAAAMTVKILTQIDTLATAVGDLRTTYSATAEGDDVHSIFLSSGGEEVMSAVKGEQAQYEELVKTFHKGFTTLSARRHLLEFSIPLTKIEGVMNKKERYAAIGLLASFLSSGVGNFNEIKRILEETLDFMHDLDVKITNILVGMQVPLGDDASKKKVRDGLPHWMSTMMIFGFHILKMHNTPEEELRLSYHAAASRPSRVTTDYPEFLPNGFLVNAKKLLS